MKIALRIAVAVIAAAAFCGEAPAHAERSAVKLATSAGAFSPNGDGREDVLSMRVTVAESSALDADVVDRYGVTVATLAIARPVGAGTTRLAWNGRSDAGRRAADDRYAISVRATSADYETGEAVAHVVVDTQAPHIRWRFPTPFRMTRATRQVPISVSDRNGVTEHAVVDVEAQSGTHVTQASVRVRPRGLSVRPLSRLDAGLYHLRLHVSDVAGNTGVSADGSVLLVYRAPTRVVSRFLGVGRHMALTFDDCNSGSSWSRMLSTLKRFHVKATFFCPGSSVAAHRRDALRTLRMGDTIGDHSWDHPNLARYSYGAARSQFLRDQAIWWRLAKATPMPFFRPPYGSYDRTTLAAAGSVSYRWTVLWDVDTRDWTLPGASTIASRVLHETRPGSIVLMHVLPETAAALPTILRGLRARHYRPLPLDALFLLPGARPSAGGWAR
jgi:peptidoglycan/xylan/chitin deacetylase (PgdA/CDA1 family)